MKRKSENLLSGNADNNRNLAKVLTFSHSVSKAKIMLKLDLVIRKMGYTAGAEETP